MATLSVATPALAGTNYYVDNTVSASGDGSFTAPFLTIQAGLNRLVPGDTLWLRGDAAGRVYSDNLFLPIHGTAAQAITVKAYPTEKVVLTGTAGTRLIINKDYWMFDGLIIDQAGLAADAVRINAKYIVIKNVEIRNGQRDGIAIEEAAFVTIQDSYIHDFTWLNNGMRMDAHCIVIETNRSPNITDIKIHRNTIERCSGDGVQVFGLTGQPISTYAKNLEFVENTFIDGTTEAGLTENALDFKAADTVRVKGNTMTGYKNNKTIVVQKGCRNITLENNTLSHGLSGIEMRQEGGIAFLQQNQSVSGNIIHHMASYALKFDGVINIRVLHNTLANIGQEAFRFASTLGTSVPAVDGGLIKNNLIYAVSQASSGASGVSQVDVGYNGWFLTAPKDMYHTTDTTGTDPFFVDAVAGNYHLQGRSPAIDTGTPVGRSFTGPAPDLGALEYSSARDTTLPASPSRLRIAN
jgi:hypothetical protein